MKKLKSLWLLLAALMLAAAFCGCAKPTPNDPPSASPQPVTDAPVPSASPEETVTEPPESTDVPAVITPTAEKSDPLRGSMNPICCYNGTTIVTDGEYVYCVQDNIKYEGVCRIFKAPLAGGTPECIYEGKNLNDIVYAYGWLYFTAENFHIYKLSLDGSECVLLNDDDVFSQTFREVSDSAIYFYRKESRETNGTLYKMDLDGTNVKKLEFNENEIPYPEPISKGIFLDGWIYFGSDIMVEPGRFVYYIQRVRTDGTGYERICSNWIEVKFVTDGEYLYIGGYHDDPVQPIDKVKLGDETIEVYDIKNGDYRLSEHPVDARYLWYLNGYVSYVNAETGEYVAGAPDYNSYEYCFIDGWNLYSDALNEKWILNDLQNGISYSFDEEGNVSVL